MKVIKSILLSRLVFGNVCPNLFYSPIILLNNTDERLDYQEVVKQALRDLGCEIIDISKNNDLFHENVNRASGYFGLHVTDFSKFPIFTKTQVINSVPGARSIFGDKEYLTNLQRMSRYEQGVEEITPKSFHLPYDGIEFSSYIQRHPFDIFIKKKLNTHSGSGVQVMKGKDISYNLDEPFVVQKYITDPLLINGDRKFDVRWWCLITNVYPNFTAYMLKDGWAKIAYSTRYDKNDLSNKCGQITNNAVQKQCSLKTRNSHNPFHTIVTSFEFEKLITPVKSKVLFEGAKVIMLQLLKSSIWRLQVNLFLSKLKAKSTQLLAIDVIYERENARAWLLEVNTNGYLRAGILKVPNGRRCLREMFQLSSYVPPLGPPTCWEKLDV